MHNLPPQAAIWANIGILLLVIEIVVLIHEFGHFIVAKMSGVRVAEFSLGMGPALFQVKRNGTTFSFRLFPIGGYVAVLSKHTISEIERIKSKNPNEEQVAMINKRLHGLTLDEDYSWQKPIEDMKWSRKALFAAMGVIFNFISVILVLIISYGTMGKQVSRENAVILVGQTSNRLEKIEILDRRDDSVIVIQDYMGIRNFLKDPRPVLGDYEEDIKVSIPGLPNKSYPNWVYDAVENGDMENDLEPSRVNGFVRTDTDIMWTWNIFNPKANEYQTWSNTIRPDVSYWTEDAHTVNMGQGPTQYTKETWNIFMPRFDKMPGSDEYPDQPYWSPIGRVVNGKGIYGISHKYFHEEMALQRLHAGDAIVEGLKDSFVMFGQSWVFIGDIFSFGAISRNSDAHAQIIFDVNAVYWFSTITNLMVVISLLIIAFNILPIPPLDGFKIGESFYNGITGKEIPTDVQTKINKAGWIFVVTISIASIFAFI